MPTSELVETVTAGVDWVSMSMPLGAGGYYDWWNTGIHLLERVVDEGYTLEPRRMLGYEGQSAGNCFVGEGKQGLYAQFTGEKADWAYDGLRSSEAHYSRIDVQVSVKYKELPLNIAKEAYVNSKRANALLPSGRQRKLLLLIGSDGGDTCYIGSPSSLQRWRIYNKERQSDDPRYNRTWRFECVFRNELASDWAERHRSRTLNHQQYCLETCIRWFESRGVGIRGIGSGEVVALPLMRSLPTDVERKLRWLDEQVKPTIQYLCGLGFRDTLLSSLFDGLTDQT